MRLGVNVAYWGLGLTAEEQLRLVREAERLGYDSVWAAEAYGSDAATVLAWLAGQTERIAIGSAIFQMPARSPAMTAMTAVTLDQISGGRFRLGLGPSGPQVSEGWHGVRFGRQLQRTREYVEGAARAGRSLEEFEIAPTVNVLVSEDVEAARDAMRPVLALYVGGMGSRK